MSDVVDVLDPHGDGTIRENVARGTQMTADCPAFLCPLDNHDECWREYERQEDEIKYSRL